MENFFAPTIANTSRCAACKKCISCAPVDVDALFDSLPLCDLVDGSFLQLPFKPAQHELSFVFENLCPPQVNLYHDNKPAASTPASTFKPAPTSPPTLAAPVSMTAPVTWDVNALVDSLPPCDLIADGSSGTIPGIASPGPAAQSDQPKLRPPPGFGPITSYIPEVPHPPQVQSEPAETNTIAQHLQKPESVMKSSLVMKSSNSSQCSMTRKCSNPG